MDVLFFLDAIRWRGDVNAITSLFQRRAPPLKIRLLLLNTFSAQSVVQLREGSRVAVNPFSTTHSYS